MRASSAHATASAYYCNVHLSHFVDVLANIDGQLDVGMSYREYRAAYRQAIVAYKRIPWTQVSGGCLSGVGVPAERALNEYRVALNLWANCLSREFRDSSCDPNSADINRRLNVQWHMAHRNLSTAENNLAN